MTANISSTQGLFRSLLSGIRWTFLHKLIAAGAGLGVSVLSARLLGIDGYGALQYVLSMLQLVIVFGAFGLNNIILRETAASTNENAWGRSRGAMTFAFPLMVVLTSLCALLIGWVTIWPLHPDLVWLFVLGFAATLTRQMAVPLTAFLNGLRRIALSGLGETMRSLMLLGFLAVAYFILLPDGAWPEAVMTMRAVAGLGSLILLLVLTVSVSVRLPGCFFKTAPIYDIARWIPQGASLMLVAGSGVIFANSDILMIGAILDTASVGPYHAASRVAELATFALAITITPLGPIITKLYAAEQRVELRSIVRRSTKINLVIGFIVTIVLVIFAVPLLRIFGAEFSSAATALRILVVAQLFNVAAGPVQLLLIMTGHQKFAALGVIVAAASNITLNAVLIPLLGVDGAAIGTAVAIVSWNLLLLYFVRKYVFSSRGAT
jgi:O-antigen/teichoic acid export membrane protein